MQERVCVRVRDCVRVCVCASQEGRDVQTLALAGDVDAAEEVGALDIDEPFTKAMLDFDPSADFTPTVADAEMLNEMERSEVYVLSWPQRSVPKEFYRNMIPDVPVVLCHSCNHFFHEEDWEFAVMQKGACPFCAEKIDASYGSGAVEPESRDTEPTGL
eukprot:6176569-Pleurochrysis_carterae.AAC.1